LLLIKDWPLKNFAKQLPSDRDDHGNGCPGRDLRFSQGAVICITASELGMSIISGERAARRHCPPEHCSGEKKLLHLAAMFCGPPSAYSSEFNSAVTHELEEELAK
jgi:hypothetical protein